jgi:hypothetical protein
MTFSFVGGYRNDKAPAQGGGRGTVVEVLGVIPIAGVGWRSLRLDFRADPVLGNFRKSRWQLQML